MILVFSSSISLHEASIDNYSYNTLEFSVRSAILFIQLIAIMLLNPMM